MIQKRQLEFKKGDLVLLSVDQTDNIFDTSKYTLIDFFPRILYHNFQRKQNVFFLVISIIMIIGPFTLTPFYRWIVAVPLAFNVFFYGLKEYLLNSSRRSNDYLINNQTTNRAKYDSGTLEEVKWMDLVIGDILYLKKGDTVPADIILLDSGQVLNREAQCMIDTQATDGRSVLTKKKSSYLTQLLVTRTRQKNNYIEYRKTLTGRLEYEVPNGNTESFIGTLKLKKDPKQEQLSIDNFIPKGSKIRQTSWIFGLVVYTGKDTKMMMCSDYPKSKMNHLCKISNQLSMLMIILVTFFSICSITVLLSRSDDAIFIYEYGTNGASGYKIFNLLVLYSQLLPIGLFLVQDIIQLFSKYQLEKNQIQQLLTKVNDSTTLSDLGQANFMLLDKTGTLTTSYQKIDCILFGKQKYCFTHDEMFRDLHTRKKAIQRVGNNQIENDNDYLINFENEDGKFLNQGQVRFEAEGEQKENMVPPLKIQNPKKNQTLFASNNRQPMRPGYVIYDVDLQQQNEFSISDFKSAMNDDFKLPVSNEKDESVINMLGVINNNLTSVRRTIYQSQADKRNENLETQQRNQNEDYIGLVQNYLHMPPQSHYQRSKDEHHLIYDSFLKCLILCHEARPVYTNTDVIEYESYSKIEEVALQFAALQGYILERFNKFDCPDEYFCRIGKEVIKYKVLGLNQFTEARNLNSIVVQAPQSSIAKCPYGKDYASISQLSCSGSKNGSVLICKGDYEALRDLLDVSLKEREELEVMLAVYKRRGVRMIIYATRELTEKETEEYSLTFNNLKSSLTNQEDQLEQLAMNYEKNLNILGILGFKEEIKQEALDFIRTMKNSNICCWMLSGDEEASTISCAHQLEMLYSLKSKILRIHGLSRDDIFIEINNCLGVVQNELTKNSEQQQINLKARVIQSSTTIYQGQTYNTINLFTCTINGQSLKLIANDSELLSHFSFLCCICRNVIGYKINPQQKQFICAMIKNDFPNNPIVIAIGDGFNDALMMQEADVSIEVVHIGVKKQFKLYVNAGDILVTSLTQIKDLVLGEGKHQSERTSNVILFMFYQSIFLGMTLFFYDWYVASTSKSIHDSMTIFFIQFIFVVPNALALGLSDIPTIKEINQYFPALYVDGQVRKQHFVRLFFLQSVVDGIFQSACVFYSSIYFLPGNTTVPSKTLPLNTMITSTVIIYSILFVSSFKIFFALMYRKVQKVIFTQILTIGLAAAFIVINYKQGFSQWDYIALSKIMFQRFDVLITFLFNIISCYFINFMVNTCIRLYHLPTAYEQFQFFNNDGEAWNDLKNEDILEQTIDKSLDMSEIVKKVFKDVSFISPYVQESIQLIIMKVLNPGDTQVTEMKLKPLTVEMKELILEKKFKSVKLEESQNHFKFFLKLLAVYFGIFFVVDYTIGNQVSDTADKYIIILGVMLFFVAFSFTRQFTLSYYTTSYLMVLILVVFKIALDWVSSDYYIALSAQLLLLLGTINSTNMQILPVLIINIIYFLSFTARIVKLGLFEQTSTLGGRIDIYTVSTIVILSFCIVVLLLFMYYRGIKQRRNDFLARLQIEQDNNSNNDILSILVPKFVQQSISSGVYSMQEAQDDIAILFLYICDFDSIMKEEGKNVVLMLDSLFRAYDNLCQQHGVQKIETVGYTYMAATGIKACESGISSHILKAEKTSRLVYLAFDMNKQVLGRKYGKGSQIEIKVGIHVGRVIAGVIGHHKPQFSLIGDPVNQTSRVGSTGDSGSITLSEQAFNKAKKDIKFYTKCQKEAKGLGIINVYQVFQEKPLNFKLSIVQQRFQAAYKMVRAEIKEQLRLGGQVPKKNTFYQNLKEKLTKQIDDNPQNLDMNHSLKRENTNNNIAGQPQDQPQITEIDEDEILKQEEDKLIENKKDIIRPNKVFLTIDDNQKKLYRNFLQISKEQNSTPGRYKIAALWFTYLILTLLLIIIRNQILNPGIIFFIRAIFIGALIILFPFFERAYQSKQVKMYYWVTLLYGCFTTLIQSYLAPNLDLSAISLLELLFILLISMNLGIFSFTESFSFIIAAFVCFLITYSKSQILTHYYVLYVLGAVILILIIQHQRLRENIGIFNNLQINEERKVKQLALVSQLLPTHAFLKLRNSSLYNKQGLIDEFSDVTLLFADIKGFTEYSNSQTPEGVVNMLRNLFTEFDKQCQIYNVYKVYTIGDCYVVMGFTNSAKRNPIQEAINTVNIGFAMIRIIQEVKIKINFKNLDMRIGIHTGQVIGGIIGTDIVRYDIYGKDVSIANKMESNGVEGRIMVSDTTKSMIDRSEKNPFKFQKIKEVDLPKFGVCYDGYLVEQLNEFSVGDDQEPNSIRKI